MFVLYYQYHPSRTYLLHSLLHRNKGRRKDLLRSICPRLVRSLHAVELVEPGCGKHTHIADYYTVKCVIILYKSYLIFDVVRMLRLFAYLYLLTGVDIARREEQESSIAK